MPRAVKVLLTQKEAQELLEAADQMTDDYANSPIACGKTRMEVEVFRSALSKLRRAINNAKEEWK